MKTKQMALEALKYLLNDEHKFLTKQGRRNKAHAARFALEADIARVVEPVAWMCDGSFTTRHSMAGSWRNIGTAGPVTPLYTSPQEAAAPELVNAELLEALISIVDYGTYETEYDGQMLLICHGCGTQDDTHSPKCAFVVARAAINKAGGTA